MLTKPILVTSKRSNVKRVKYPISICHAEKKADGYPPVIERGNGKSLINGCFNVKIILELQSLSTGGYTV